MRHIVPALGALASVFLITQVGLRQILTGLVLLLAGVSVYVLSGQKGRLHDVYEEFFSREAVHGRAYGQAQSFLAHPLHHLKRMIHKRKGIGPAWLVEKK
jgi:drug/metabolite transporter (DMT)-like permease